MFLVFDWWLDVIWLKSHRNATNCIDFNIVIRILNTPVSAKMAQGQRKWHVVISRSCGIWVMEKLAQYLSLWTPILIPTGLLYGTVTTLAFLFMAWIQIYRHRPKWIFNCFIYAYFIHLQAYSSPWRLPDHQLGESRDLRLSFSYPW